MQLALTETQQLIRDTASRFAREVVAPRARATDREERFPADVYAQMAELGLLGVNLPAELGGAEAGVVSYALAMMEISAACASTSVGMAVIEIKQARFRRDTPAMRRLRDSGFRPSWSSKYCAAIASTRPEVRRNRLLPGLRRLLPEVA